MIMKSRMWVNWIPASVSSSQLKTILRSPAHYREAYLSGKEKKAPTADMLLGSLTHTLFLEPEQFAEEYVELVKFNMRTNEGKAAAATFAELAAGRTPVTAEQIQQAQNMANALCDSIAYNAMTGGYAEASIFFQDADTGLQCRIRPDYHIAPGEVWQDGLIIDVKSTDDARAEAFARTCVKFGYDLSAAMYSDGFCCASFASSALARSSIPISSPIPQRIFSSNTPASTVSALYPPAPT